MNRRSFLRAAVIAAATPAAGFAPALATDIGSLVSHYRLLSDELNRADEESVAVLRRDDKPDYPHIVVNDYGPFRSGPYLNSTNCFDEDEIAALFDRERFQVKSWENVWPAEKLTDLYNEVDARHERALADFLYRKRVYDGWWENNGGKAARDRMLALQSSADRLEDQILGYPCADVTDYRLKCSFVRDVYGDEISEERIQAVLRGLLA